MEDDCTRRAFLKKFALLSAGTFVLGATTMACYGPGIPRPSLRVNGMFFLDAASNLVRLPNNQNVPVHTKFTTDFAVLINTAVAATIVFVDQNNVAVPFSQTWDNDHIVSVVPSSDLLLNTQYRLRVLEIESSHGEKITLDAEADATFRTVIA